MKADQWDAWRAKWKSCLLSIPVSILDSGSENEPDRVWVKAFNRRQDRETGARVVGSHCDAKLRSKSTSFE